MGVRKVVSDALPRERTTPTDLGLVPCSFEQRVLAERLAHEARKSEIMGASHVR